MDRMGRGGAVVAAAQQPSVWTFDDRMVMSEGESRREDIGTILMNQIPGAVSADRAEKSDDRNGTDWWVNMSNGHRLSVDCKIRSVDFSVRGEDDLALETWSVRE